ncbi:hypothetical protein M427DRAFT_56843 [Gonapodya prolifera JEL478]|uniref:F-box domain-containing protein n=1 Tax=Gonapodya prolifera (strain JEL478) TaxID=1344416 RepID=A0A139AEN7_GONPJ|nr:hypothetical protein M427DRAFT_56843 [Gonapodya prolifera JEL478]|eukprot:KXS15210.1 hypothetical protein M427DRAFT_56843 [Gonapodya prolifera JEL478]
MRIMSFLPLVPLLRFEVTCKTVRDLGHRMSAESDQALCRFLDSCTVWELIEWTRDFVVQGGDDIEEIEGFAKVCFLSLDDVLSDDFENFIAGLGHTELDLRPLAGQIPSMEGDFIRNVRERNLCCDGDALLSCWRSHARGMDMWEMKTTMSMKVMRVITPKKTPMLETTI